jgi:CHASE2 domain-containing sensor protein
MGCTYTPSSKVFWRRFRGGRRLLQGESLTHNLLLYFCFALFYFCLHLFIKNTKKLVPSIVIIFVGLLSPCFIMLCINGWFL